MAIMSGFCGLVDLDLGGEPVEPPGPPVVPCREYECDAYSVQVSSTFTNAWVCDDLSGENAAALAGGVPLSRFGNVQQQSPVTFIDGCENDWGAAISGGTGFRADNNAFITGLNGTVGVYYAVLTSSDLRVIDVEFVSNDQVSLVMGGNTIDFYIQWNGGGNANTDTFPGGGLGPGSYAIMSWTIDGGTGDYVADLWVDYVYRGQVSGTAGPINAPSSPDFRLGSTSGTGGGTVQYAGYSPAVITQEAVTALKIAYDQNQIGYTDPDCP
jgi:hypothetical protein